MTQEEALQACKRLGEEHPDRETHRWVPHEKADGSWEVAKIGLAPPTNDSTAETRADERPPTPDDPRPLRDIGGPWTGGAGI